MQNLARFRMTS